eukprot:4012768-Amphidinium_carterae.1
MVLEENTDKEWCQIHRCINQMRSPKAVAKLKHSGCSLVAEDGFRYVSLTMLLAATATSEAALGGAASPSLCTL